MCLLATVEFGLLAPEVALGFGHLHSLSSSQPDEIRLELRDHGQDVEEQPLDRIVGVVDGATQIEADLSDREFVSDGPCVGKGAGQSIEFRHHKSVALATSGQGLAKARTFTIGSGQAVINIDPVCNHPKCSVSVSLRSQVLLVSRHSGVSDESADMAHPLWSTGPGELGYRYRPQPASKDRPGPLPMAR